MLSYQGGIDFIIITKKEIHEVFFPTWSPSYSQVMNYSFRATLSIFLIFYINDSIMYLLLTFSSNDIVEVIKYGVKSVYVCVYS
jgi:hypothetical protein